MSLDVALDLKILTNLLEITQPEIIVDLKELIMQSFDNPKAMRLIVDRQCENREQTHCYSCGNEAGCLILNGIAHLALGEIKTAIIKLENANQHFRNEDMIWNHIIGLAILGNAYEKRKKDHRAFRIFEKAHHLIKNNYLRIHANDYIDKAQQLENVLKNKIAELSALGVSATPTSKTEFVDTNSNPPSVDNKDYLALFSIPIYGMVEAGPDGELYVGHLGTFTLVNKVELQGQTFDIHSVHGTTFVDKQIIVMTTRTHGWLRVHGLSMNGWNLPFEENDFVLFYRSPAASHLDYVIASKIDPSGEMALIVKRFDAENNQLLSKSKDTTNPYHPIPLAEDHQIVGVVIAVAKLADQISTVSHHNPIPKTKSEIESGVSNETSLPFMITKEMRQQLHNQGYSEDAISHMTPQQAWNNIDEDKLFQNLLTKVQGDHEAASRLIELEQRQHPRSNRKELIQLASLKWEKDNR